MISQRKQNGWKKLIASILLCGCAFFVSAQKLSALTVFAGGQCCQIVVSPQASETENFAAQELADYLGKITGGSFSVVASETLIDGPRILVGASLSPAESRMLGHDSFCIFVSGDEARLFGESPEARGNLYAVYTLLEKLGCRFYTHDVEKIPSMSEIRLANCKELQQPAFPDVRYILSMHGSGWFHDWDAKVKLDGTGWGNDVPAKYGRALEYRPYPYHTMDFLVPAKENFSTHPEYFALVGGKRVPESYCLRSQTLIQATIDACLKHLDKRYIPNMDMCIGLPDNGTHCRCEACAACEDAEGTPVANNIYFTNEVAKGVQRKYPDLQFCAIAYQYTRVPPKTSKTAPGVFMHLANIEGDFAGDLNSEQNNRRFKAEILEWQKHTDKLQYVDYGAIFSGFMLPLPNLDILPSRYSQLQELGVTGIHTINHLQLGGEFNLLRNYVTAKLMWNPHQDVWPLVYDFCEGYYGAAGQSLYEYIRYYHQLAREKGTIVYYETTYPDFLDEEFIARTKEYFAQARQAVENDHVLTERVEFAELSLRFSELFLQQSKIRRSPELQEQAREFKALCDKFQITHMGEHTIMKSWENAGDTPDFCVALKDEDWTSGTPEWWGLGVQTFREQDPVCGQESFRMTTNHVEWVIYKPMQFLNMQKKCKWDVYAHVRVVPGPKATPESIAFSGGVVISDTEIPKGKVRLSQTSDTEYRYIKLAEDCPIMEKTYAWMAPANNPEEISAVWIDHFLFVDSAKRVVTGTDKEIMALCEGLPSEKCVILAPGFYFENEKVFKEDEPLLGHDVLRLVSNCSDWAIQTKLEAAAALGGKWDLYVSVKVGHGPNANAQSVAFNGGCVVSPEEIIRRNVLQAETSETEYAVVKLAENLTLTENSTMFMVPQNNPDEVSNIWINKVILLQKD